MQMELTICYGGGTLGAYYLWDGWEEDGRWHFREVGERFRVCVN